MCGSGELIRDDVSAHVGSRARQAAGEPTPDRNGILAIRWGISIAALFCLTRGRMTCGSGLAVGLPGVGELPDRETSGTIRHYLAGRRSLVGPQIQENQKTSEIHLLDNACSFSVHVWIATGRAAHATQTPRFAG